MALANRAGLKNTRTLLRAFGGLNETYSCTEAECSSGKNFSARNFPALSTRIPRRKLRTAAPVNGMYHLNGLLVVEGTNLCYSTDDAPQTVQTVENAVTDSKKVLVGMGTKIIIFPDKAAFDTKDLSVTPLAAAWTNGNADVVLTPCDAAGKTYTVKNRGPKEPTDPADGDLFLKVVNSQVPYSSESILEIYSEASGNWSAIELNWCRIECKGIGADFAVWDTVTLSGIKDDDGGYWKGLKGDRIVYARGEDWVQVRAEPGGDYFYGTLTKSGDVIRWKSIDGKGSGLEGSPDPFRLERRVPDLDYLTECGKCHLRLQAGRPDQLVLLPRHRGGQLRRDRGQRRGFYRRVHLSGLCALFQGELHPQAVRLQALGLSAQCHPLPGRGAERQPQPLRAERDAVLPLAGRCDGVGRQRAQQGIRKTEHRPAVQCAGSSGRCAGWTVLPVSRAGQRRGEARRAAAGLRHRAGPVAGGERLLLRDGQHRRPALPLGRGGHLGCRPQPRKRLADHRGRGGDHPL